MLLAFGDVVENSTFVGCTRNGDVVMWQWSCKWLEVLRIVSLWWFFITHSVCLAWMDIFPIGLPFNLKVSILCSAVRSCSAGKLSELTLDKYPIWWYTEEYRYSPTGNFEIYWSLLFMKVVKGSYPIKPLFHLTWYGFYSPSVVKHSWV